MLLIVMRIFIIKCSILLLFNLLTVSCQKHETGLEKKSKNNRKLGLEKKNENKLIEVLQKKTDTFYQKNIIFWEKFKKREKDLKDFIDQGTKYKTINTISTILEDLLPEIAFQAGYNTILKKYEFMLSPEENRNYQTLARYWLENAPKMEGWIFYSSKPPGNLKQKLVFSMYGQNITLTDFMIKTTVNIEDQKLDIQSYHPCFKNLNKNKSLSITLLLLDEVLGEYGTELRIGTIDTSIDKLKGNQISIPNLKKYLDKLIKKYNWDTSITSDQIWAVYDRKPKQKEKWNPREDIIAGMTRNLDLIPNYGKDNLLNNTGAEYIFIMIDRACFKSDDVVGERAKMSDEILSGLSRRNQGYLMGGATGLRHCYIDFIIFDGKKSIQTIQNVIKEKYPELRGSIRYFANEKRNRIMAF